MRFLKVTAIVGLVWAAPQANAQDHQGCTERQSKVVDDAVEGAKALSLRAAGAIADTTHYARWFGEYQSLNAEKARATLKSVASVIRSGQLTLQCDPIVDTDREVGCEEGEYAWVYSDEPYLVHLCPAYFTLPSMATLQPRTTAGSNGTREGTMIHEISHFLNVAETEDHCYSRRDCSIMARRDPDRAIENADSYQYFAEDVSFYARQAPGPKPPPAPRPNR